ncbi:LysR family transcriptional regulator [Phyllobacterium sp. SB3]|uniref:LysR family transcriptional regulator n=1 Tax=Phyllobacterium sp. SB3 TaxID=3156073 RepID=UPI0032B00A98
MTHTLPPLEALEAVLSAAHLGSFSAAATALGITHGAVSRRVASAEHWAGFRLFARHGRGVRLTLEGERFAARIELAIAMLQDSQDKNRSHHGLDTVRVSVVQSFARLWLIPRLKSLEGFPLDLRIELEIDNRHMTLSDARIAIRLGQGGWPNAVSEPLFNEVLQPVACRSIAEDIGPTPEAEDLLRYPLIHDASETGWRVWLAGQNLTHVAEGKDRLFSGHDLALLAAASGVGIALLRRPYGSEFSNLLGLVPVHPAVVDNYERFHIATRPGPRHATVERLLKRFRRQGANHVILKGTS